MQQFWEFRQGDQSNFSLYLNRSSQSPSLLVVGCTLVHFAHTFFLACEFFNQSPLFLLRVVYELLLLLKLLLLKCKIAIMDIIILRVSPTPSCRPIPISIPRMIIILHPLLLDWSSSLSLVHSARAEWWGR